MFEGVLPAIITPFKRNSAMGLDVQGLERNIGFLLSCGVHGIVPCGSTGESATLTFEEHEKVIEIAVDKVNGRIPVLAGQAPIIQQKLSGSRRLQRTSARMVFLL